MQVTGDQLHADDRRAVLAQYLYRMTVEAQRQWPEVAHSMRENGWRMPDRTDAEWLAATQFHVRRNGRLDARYSFCETSWDIPALAAAGPAAQTDPSLIANSQEAGKS